MKGEADRSTDRQINRMNVLIDRMTGTQRDGCIDEQTEGKPKDI